MGIRIVLWYAPKQCPTHGRVQEEIAWAPYARVTYRLEWRLCALCDHDPEGRGGDPAAAASTLNLLHRVITRVRHGPSAA